MFLFVHVNIKMPWTVLLNNVSLQVWLWVDLRLCADVHKSDGSQMVHFCIYPLNGNCRGAKSAFQSCRLDLCVSLNTQTGEQKYFNLVPKFPPVRQFVFAATQAHFLSRYSDHRTNWAVTAGIEPFYWYFKWPLLVKHDNFNGLRFENI